MDSKPSTALMQSLCIAASLPTDQPDTRDGAAKPSRVWRSAAKTKPARIVVAESDR